MKINKNKFNEGTQNLVVSAESKISVLKEEVDCSKHRAKTQSKWDYNSKNKAYFWIVGILEKKKK